MDNKQFSVLGRAALLLLTDLVRKDLKKQGGQQAFDKLTKRYFRQKVASAEKLGISGNDFVALMQYLCKEVGCEYPFTTDDLKKNRK